MTVYRVNTMTLTEFTHYLRDHGIPCSIESAKRMIEAGVFDNAAYACKGLQTGLDEEPEPVTTYVIIPKRLDAWFRENADEERVYSDEAG
ncbi:MAG: hypothetical protein LUC47_07740 [Clostridiales bacterium]|nr:hypothetical protein [Clostridiales bacterium]